MKERPILFSTEMVQAILQGRKTQTRRVVNAAPSAWGFNVVSNNIGEIVQVLNIDANESSWKEDGSEWVLRCPYGKIGDVLWVRETWAKNSDGWYIHKASFGFNHKWKPSIHMPKEACRLKLRIMNIRVERLQSISNQDAVAEGIVQTSAADCYLNPMRTDNFCFEDAKGAFKNLWGKINGEQSWNDNPWVWVIEFEKI